MTLTEIKRTARAQLYGKYPIPIAAVVIAAFLPSLLLMPFSALLKVNTVYQIVLYYSAAFLIYLLTFVLRVGISYLSLELAAERPISLRQIIFCFKNRPDSFIFAAFLFFAMLLPWSVPGFLLDLSGRAGWAFWAYAVGFVVQFYVYLNFSQVFFLLLEDTSRPVRSLFSESRQMMRGHKKEFLVLHLSFLGYFALSILSFGLGFLWTLPYFRQARTVYFLSLRNNIPDASASFVPPA